MSEVQENKQKETKVCKYCQSEIPKKAKVCPQCRKKQKGGIGKWIALVLVIGLIGSCMGGETTEEEKNNTVVVEDTKDNNTDAVVEETVEELEEVEEVAENDGKEVLSLGDSFEARGLKVTINDIDTEFTDYEDEYGWYALEDGMKYVMSSFTFENTGDSDAYVSIYDFDCYADGELCEQSYNFGGDFINANLSAGRKVSFETHYVVPVDAQEIELEYTSNVWTSEKVIIKLQ